MCDSVPDNFLETSHAIYSILSKLQDRYDLFMVLKDRTVKLAVCFYGQKWFKDRCGTLQQYHHTILFMILHSLAEVTLGIGTVDTSNNFFLNCVKMTKNICTSVPTLKLWLKNLSIKNAEYFIADYCLWHSLNACPKHGAFSCVLLNYYLQLFKSHISSFITSGKATGEMLSSGWDVAWWMRFSLVDEMKSGVWNLVWWMRWSLGNES